MWTPPAALLLLSMTLPFASALSEDDESSSKRPNIVFILADDQGYNDIGYRENSRMKTPNLDELAASGVKLNNYYVQPICTPSRSQLMSGMYQIHTGLSHGVIERCQPNGLPLQFPTIANVLKEVGYSTHAVGKWHLGFYTKKHLPTNRGFDTFFGIIDGASGHMRYKVCTREFSKKRPCGYSLYKNDQSTTEGNGTYSTHLYTGKAIELIESAAKQDKPMFLYLAYQAVHTPLNVPDEYKTQYTDIKDETARTYAGMVSALDEGVGNVTQALKDSGLWNNTIIIYSSDNGGKNKHGASNWPLKGGKATLWEGGIRSIGFVASPLIKNSQKGTVRNQLVHISDWFPTMVAMAGIKRFKSVLKLDGVNQWRMISKGDSEKGKRLEILHNIDSLAPCVGQPRSNGSFNTQIRAALRVGDYKIITGEADPISDITGNGAVLKVKNTTRCKGNKNLWLFNIANDPGEQNDLSDSMPDKVNKMLDRLAKHYSTAVPPIYPASDRKCDPHRGPWAPWMEDTKEPMYTHGTLFV